MHTIQKRSLKVELKMNLSKTIRHFFSTIIIGVEIDHKNCKIVAQFYKGNKKFQTQTKIFKTIPGELSAQAVRYIKKIRTKNPFTYIATQSSSIVQGAISTSNKEEFAKYGININEVVSKSFYNNWSVYIAKDGIAETQKRFLKTGVDFIVSPFLVLYSLAKRIPQEDCRLYILFQRSNMTMIVKKQNEEVLFGGYYVLESEIDSELKIVKNTLSEDEDEIQKINIQDNIQDELNEIEEVDVANEHSDNELIEILKSENEEMGDEAKEENLEDSSDEDLDDFSRVSMASKFIQSAINEFYNNEIYESEFIREIVIFNPCDIQEETLKQIQNFTMLEVQIAPCNIAEILAELGFESYCFFEAKGEV